MELIVQAGGIVLGQLLGLVQLWVKANNEGLSKEEIAQEIEKILGAQRTSEDTEWSIVRGDD